MHVIGVCLFIVCRYSGFGWVVGVGKYIGKTKGVVYTRQETVCPTEVNGQTWRYLDKNLEWKDNGKSLFQN